MTAWKVTFEVDVPEAYDDGDAIAHARGLIDWGEGIITVEPVDPPPRFQSFDPRTQRP